MTGSKVRWKRFSRWFVLAVASLAFLLGGDPRKAPAAAPVAPEVVELFAAMKSGDIEVKLIPKNDRESRVILKNNTKRPLNVRLPDAFAGVPVLAQGFFGPNNGPNNGPGRNNPGNNANNVNQPVGGANVRGNNGMLPGGFNNNQRNGFFNLPPEKVGDFKLVTICLEHGKKDPRPGVPYEIRPIETVTSKPAVQALCGMLGDPRIDQRAVQAAGWHLANGLTWDELAAKRIEHLNAPGELYFTADQLVAAKEIAKQAVDAAAKRSPTDAGKQAVATGSDAPVPKAPPGN